VGKKLIHSLVGNPDMIATNVELLGENWRAYQSLGHGIYASLSSWEFCETKGYAQTNGDSIGFCRDDEKY